jgi:hypothetical protein
MVILSGGTRDMSKAQFREAAKRNGFVLGPFGLETYDLADCSSCSYGYICQRKPFRILRRASLAAAIQKREADYARVGRRA